jgi:hypothetical protein
VHECSDCSQAFAMKIVKKERNEVLHIAASLTRSCGVMKKREEEEEESEKR